MAAKTPIDKLTDAIGGILSEYAGEVQENVGQIAVQLGKKGVNALRQQSRRTFKSRDGKFKYAKGWKMKEDRGRLYTTATIYNDHYSLPHLLEYGHATRNGTEREYDQTPGREHIAPVADELVETFEREVVSKL